MIDRYSTELARFDNLSEFLVNKKVAAELQKMWTKVDEAKLRALDAKLIDAKYQELVKLDD